jgi:hypothetical protein
MLLPLQHQTLMCIVQMFAWARNSNTLFPLQFKQRMRKLPQRREPAQGAAHLVTMTEPV